MSLTSPATNGRTPVERGSWYLDGTLLRSTAGTAPQPGPTIGAGGFSERVAGDQVGDGSRSAQHCSVYEKAASPEESAWYHVAEADARTREENQMRSGGQALPTRRRTGGRGACDEDAVVLRGAAAARSAAGALLILYSEIQQRLS